MEVVSNSNLVSSETEKITTTCDFQNDFVMKLRSYAYIQI